MNTAREQISLCYKELLNAYPFYASLLSTIKIQATDSVKTAGVGYVKDEIYLYYNEEFVLKHTIFQMMHVIIHELLHIIFLHHFRAQDRKHKLWNIACDLAVNSEIPGISFVLPDCLTPAKFHYEEHLTAEQYYDLLVDEKYEADISDNVAVVQNGANSITGEVGTFPTQIDDAGLSENIVKSKVRHAYSNLSEKARGSIPSNVRIAVDKMLRPPVLDWQARLKSFIGRTIKANKRKTFLKPNRYFGFGFPGVSHDRKCKITVAIDTSGSTQDDLIVFLSELDAIKRVYKADITIIECDADVGRCYKLKRGGKIDFDLTGGGGTCFDPVFAYVKEKRISTDVLFYFTDGDGYLNISSKPTYQVVWVTTGTDQFVFGDVIKFPKNKKTDND